MNTKAILLIGFMLLLGACAHQGQPLTEEEKITMESVFRLSNGLIYNSIHNPSLD